MNEKGTKVYCFQIWTLDLWVHDGLSLFSFKSASLLHEKMALLDLVTKNLVSVVYYLNASELQDIGHVNIFEHMCFLMGTHTTNPVDIR